jgi:bifunctional DNA-binding transcriptional regulator/antitoxin component of YhaV-PrlF toxin-antitoxin module
VPEVVPFELTIDEEGCVLLPLGLLAQAGLDAGATVLAVAGHQDGYLVLRRLGDAQRDLLSGKPPV